MPPQEVLVQCVPHQLDMQKVQELFSQIGPVQSLKLKQNWEDNNYFVKFHRAQDAQTAVDQLNGFEILGKTLRVSFAETVEQIENVVEARNNLIVNYLPLAMTQTELHSLFAPIGDIQHCKLMRDTNTGDSLSFGFIRYHRPEDAAKAIELLNGLKIQNKILKVSYSRPGSEQIKGANLYVSNLPRIATQEDVLSLFRTYGNVINCRLIYDNLTEHRNACGPEENSLGIPKGLAFVLYDKRSEAEMAIKMLHNAFYRGQIINVRFARSIIYPQLPPLQPELPLEEPQLSLHQPQLLLHQPQISVYLPRLALHHLNIPLNSLHFPIHQPPQLSYTFQVIQWWNIFVYGFGLQVDETVLFQQFRQFGSVQHVKIIFNRRTNKRRSYGFVIMTNYFEALNAIRSLNGFILQGQPLQVRFSSCSIELVVDETWTF